MDVLSDSSMFSNNGDITTKEILKRIGDRSVTGTKQYETELVNRQDYSRPMATRVDTDPTAYQNERSVRHVQEPQHTIPYSTPQGTPPQKWANPDNGQSPHRNQYERSERSERNERNENVPQPNEPESGQRREWRNSGWSRQNSSVATGTN